VLVSGWVVAVVELSGDVIRVDDVVASPAIAM
jgi:hypothetical protein